MEAREIKKLKTKKIRFWSVDRALGLYIAHWIYANDKTIEHLYKQIKENKIFFCTDVDIYNLSNFAMIDWIEEPEPKILSDTDLEYMTVKVSDGSTRD